LRGESPRSLAELSPTNICARSQPGYAQGFELCFRIFRPAKKAGITDMDKGSHMSQNLIDLNLSSETLSALNDAIVTLESHLGGLIALDPKKRQNLTKMGNKSEAFCRQAVVVFSENSEVLPRNFDLQGFQRDLATLDALRPAMVRLNRLAERLQDTDMALGSDLMTNALEGYAVLKVAGKGKGLDNMRQALSARFARRRAGEVAEEPAASE
jgi:hypothetical protein